MKTSPFRSFFTLTVAGLMVAGLFSLSIAKAAGTQAWDGSDDTWDVGTTPDWNGTQTWVNGNNAQFFNGGGTVTVSDQGGTAPVKFDTIELNGGTGYDIKGSTLTATGEDHTYIQVDGGSANNTIDSNLVVPVNHRYFDRALINNYGTGTLTVNNLEVVNTGIRAGDGDASTDQYLSVNAGAGGKIVLNGAVTTDGVATSAILFGYDDPSSLGTYEIKGTIQSNIGIALLPGTLLIGTNGMTQGVNLIGFNYTTGASVLTDGAITYNGNIGNQNDELEYFGGTTAGTSNFNGNFQLFGRANFVTAGGGRVNINGQINAQLGQGLVTSGNGTVAFNYAGGSNYGTTDGGNGYTVGTTAATLGATMTLINNGSGTEAFGGGSAHTVNLLANSGLGGNGGTAENIVAADSSSVIAPGDGTSIATLTLAGGLNASNGLTMDFKLNGDAMSAGVNNDLINVANLTLSGTINVNFTNLGTAVDTTTDYTLMFGSGTWTDNGATFVISAPSGYADDLTYGADQDTPGYIFDNSGDNSFSVRFIAVPEPSTYGLMGLALLALVSVGRWMRRGAAV